MGYGNIGNTSENTVIGLGEVDFGTDGNAYQATGVEFANGWGTYGEAKYVVLSAGATPEEAVPFNESGWKGLSVTTSSTCLPKT